MLPTSARAADFSFKYGNQVPANHPVTMGFQQAVDRIKAETASRVEIGMFPNNALGGDTDMLSQLRSRTPTPPGARWTASSVNWCGARSASAVLPRWIKYGTADTGKSPAA